MKAEQQYIDLFAQCEDLVCRHSTPVMNALRADALATLSDSDSPPREARIINIRM